MHDVEVFYLTNSYLEKGRNSYFVAALRIIQSTKNLSVNLILPERALLARPLSALNPPVNPYPYFLDTTGRQITIFCLKKTLMLMMFFLYL